MMQSTKPDADREYWRLSARELVDGFAAGRILPSQAFASVVERIQTANPVLNLFATLDTEGARTAAAESDARWRSGRELGSLDGVPITIKDNLNVAGLPTAWGTALFRGRIPPRDETPVARLRAAGCVIVGKTNVPEFALGRGNTSTATFGVTRNPWNPALTPGSSTGGGAAAVAAGVAPIALATDGGGSIRRPASYCGVLGLKTSAGLVGRRFGLPQTALGMETVGALTRTVDDMALVLAAIQGPERGDRASEAIARAGEEPLDIGRLRIRYVPRFGVNTVEPDAIEACARAAIRMSALGHHVVETDVPFDLTLLERSVPVLRDTGLALILRNLDWPGQISERFAPMIEAGTRLKASDYLAALLNIEEACAQIADAFADYDLMMTPAAAAMPWKAEEDGPSYHSTYPAFANAAGLPGIAIPSGFSLEGMPTGFQLVGRPGCDWQLVAIARAYERAYPWADLWPSCRVGAGPPARQPTMEASL
jgi:aspartyl-tRNA(Asn)/glutamyl-tRNA(Gln) amidotransferase subunit A